jgi:copper(I)-binding protein
MNRILSGALALLLLVSPIAAYADDVFTLGTLEISAGFSRATLPNAPVGAGYLTITNKGAADDRLVSVSTPAAGTAEVHEMKMENGVMSMRPRPIPTPASASATASPGRVSSAVRLSGARTAPRPPPTRPRR